MHNSLQLKIDMSVSDQPVAKSCSIVTLSEFQDIQAKFENLEKGNREFELQLQADQKKKKIGAGAEEARSHAFHCKSVATLYFCLLHCLLKNFIGFCSLIVR